MCGQMTNKTASIHYNVSCWQQQLATDITNSHVATTEYHMHYTTSMACMGAAVISVMSCPYTV